MTDLDPAAVDTLKLDSPEIEPDDADTEPPAPDTEDADTDDEVA